MLSGTKLTKAGGGSSSSSTAAAVVAGAGPGSSRQPLTVRDLEHVQQLHTFFNSLVDDMSANVQRLALRGLNAWLVSAADGRRLRQLAEEAGAQLFSRMCAGSINGRRQQHVGWPAFE